MTWSDVLPPILKEKVSKLAFHVEVSAYSLKKLVTTTTMVVSLAFIFSLPVPIIGKFKSNLGVPSSAEFVAVGLKSNYLLHTEVTFTSNLI